MKSRHPGPNAPVHSRVAAFRARSAIDVSRIAQALAAALPLLAADAAIAQSAPDTPTQQVVVTAARVEQKLPDTLPATTLISRHDIESAPATDLPGLLSELTSLSVAQLGPFGSQTSVFMRGANSGQVLVLVDGAPVTRADAGSSPWELLPLGQVDHIEIVRGNLSSLYGSDAVGGVIQIFTKSGDHASMMLGGGSRGRVLADVSLGRRFGDAGHALDIGGSVSGQVSAGYNATDPATNPGNNPDRDGGYQSGENLRIGKTWAPGQRTDLRVMHSDTTSDYDGFSGPAAFDRLTTSLDTQSLNSHHALGASLTLGVELSDTLIKTQDPSAGQSGNARSSVAGVDLDWTVAADHRLQLGLEDRKDRGAALLPDFSGYTSLDRTTRSVRLGYVGSFDDVVDVQANVRRDDPSDFDSATTGLLALGWRLSPAWKLVGQFSTAFSAPPFFAIESRAGQGLAVQLKPERSRELEFGVHYQHAGLQARATWFSQHQHDLIDYTSDPVTFESTAYNVDRATNRGVELAVDGDTRFGKLGLDATLQDARGDGGVPLERRPRADVSVNYRVPLWGWETGVYLHRMGPHHDYDPLTFGDTTSRSRTTLGLSTQHALSPNWAVGLKVDNATNATAPAVFGYTAPPREVVATLRGSW
jgi:vitamin B12 transporter